MALTLKLYNFSKKHNSTKQLVNDAAPVATFTDFVLKQNTDIDTPTFLIDDELRDVNYAYLVELGRFYFINKYRLGNRYIYELECELDTLATYKTYILLYEAFVERCADANYFNPDIMDNALSVEDMVSATDSASTDVGFASALVYIVRIFGRGDTNGIGAFLLTQFQLANIFSQMWVDIDDGLGLGDLEEFMQMWIADPIKYIVGIYSSPIGVSIYNNNCSQEDIYIGGHKTNLSAPRINHGEVKIHDNLVLNKPSSIYSDFRKTDPAFSQYTIYIPTIGTLPLSADLMDTTLTLGLSADLFTGDLLFTLKSDGDIVASYTSNCYATQSVGVANQASSIMGGASKVLAGGATGSPAGAAIGLIDGIKTSFDTTPSVIGSQGNTAFVTTATDVVISVVQKASAEFPLAVAGRPCCKNLLLSNLTGYVKCGGASLDVPANEAVKLKLNAFLNEGFYIEQEERLC